MYFLALLIYLCFFAFVAFFVAFFVNFFSNNAVESLWVFG